MTDRMNNNTLPHHLELDHVDYLSVFKDFDEGVIITDMAGEIVYYNEAMAKLLDLTDQAGVRSPEDGYRCKVNINVFHQTPPWPRNDGTDRLLSIWQAAAHSLDMQVVPEERGGLSDGNQIWPHIPTIDGLGPSGRNAHCSEQSEDGSKEQEYVVPSSFVPKALLNIIATLNLINTPG